MKYWFLSFFLSLFVSPVWSQVEFAPSGAEWYYRYNPGYFTANSGGFSHAQVIGDTVLDGRNLPAGFYVLTAEVAGVVVQQKFVKY